MFQILKTTCKECQKVVCQVFVQNLGIEKLMFDTLQYIHREKLSLSLFQLITQILYDTVG